ncbi:hypothetical protein BD289DRAFT_378735 [Coniella lustricola]|uniref:Uncharacterized protein n=1 Tax=Coniella lustricola TaxID=2025994 RepID=A0A2T2ZTQ9_9PEZI|nr:hypothetical protein BD289DRAFT_378735 [Coniella lustricola]
MPSLIQRIQSKIELFRLERRYTRNRDRRSTFVSNAIYVDGEYIYQTPSSTGSTYNSNSSSSNSTPVSEHPPSPLPGSTHTSAMPRSVMPSMSSSNNYNDYNNNHTTTSAQRKKMHRFSSIHGFGSSSKGANAVAPSSDWRPQRASFDGGR